MNNAEKIIAAACLFLAVSCSSNDPYLYDRTGFDQAARPIVAPNPKAVNTTPPDYYRQQQQYNAPYQQVPQQPYSTYQPAYQQAPQQAPAYGYPAAQGGSRYYSNPYAIPPSTQYYQQRYDVDQYYVPPSSYYSNDQQMRSTGYN